MPSFDESSLPDDLAAKAQTMPIFNTRVVTMASGKEQRVGLNSRGRLKMVLSEAEMTPTQMDTLVAFYRGHAGQLYGFRVKDWTDYKAVNAPLVNPSPATTLQLTKTYGSGAFAEIRKILKPVAGTVSIRKNGTLWAGTNWSLDTTTGIVTLTGSFASGDVFDWSGQFDVPMRFETDSQAFTNSAATVRGVDNIALIEII